MSIETRLAKLESRQRPKKALTLLFLLGEEGTTDGRGHFWPSVEQAETELRNRGVHNVMLCDASDLKAAE